MVVLIDNELKMANDITHIQRVDPELAAWIDDEQRRQQEHIELIASENYASPAILEAQGSILTNKYAEGYPGKRYYGGCEVVDQIELLAIERAKKLFSCNYANVQPHSGSSANAAVFLALLKSGDKILGMDLSAGGHLTHGSPVNFSGKLYEAHSYSVRPETGLVDMEDVAQQARRIKPKLLIAGFSAYSRVLDWQRFRAIADEVGAYLLVDMAHVSGLVAAGLYPNPVPHAHVVTSTTHKTLRGPRSGIILSNDEALFKKLNSAIFPGSQGGPLMHVIAAKATCFRLAAGAEFKQYQLQVIKNAQAMAQAMHAHGAGVLTGGTDTHQFLVDLTGYGITGRDAQHMLERANITLNKNSVPNDPLSPMVTSGIRIGTPAVTSRGMKEAQMLEIANVMQSIFQAKGSEQSIESARLKMLDLAARFPLVGCLK